MSRPDASTQDAIAGDLRGRESDAVAAASATAPALTPLYDVAALRTLEARAIELLGGDADVLMQRAGQAAWRHALRHWPQAQGIVVLCGPGNNGGDGYVFARHALESGREVAVLRLDAHAPRGALAQAACAAYLSAGGRIEGFAGALPACDLVVDALFGIGLDRAPDAEAAALIAAVAGHGVPVLALDVPSGVDAARAAVPGAAIAATRTLQFIAAHAGLATGPALDHVGETAVADLSLPEAAFADVAPAAEAVHPAGLRTALPRRPRSAHKGASGHVLVIGGDHGKGGAALLAAEAALRAGAGLVSLATRDAHVAAALSRRPEIMTAAVESADALAPLCEAASVIAIGPGLGQGAWGRSLFAAALAAGKPLVLDADALNLLADGAASPSTDVVLTPHPGEAARLLGIASAAVQADRYRAARALRTRYGGVVVLKGAGTVVTAPEATVAVIAAGNPGMAVGGMGDVLTGVIAALRAQGLDAAGAARIGALLHAAAGDAAAHHGGERGLLPSDLFAALRRLANP